MQKTFIGTQLRQLRREKGQTQAEMGRVLGVSCRLYQSSGEKPAKPIGFNFDGFGG
jgi:DNA-binding transcriptional regulator YiaG